MKITRKAISLFLSVPILLGIAKESSAAVLVNISDEPVYVARHKYESGSSSTAGGLQVFTPSCHGFNGWQKVEPFDYVDYGIGKNSNLYVEKRGNPLKWSSLETFTGVVDKTNRFSLCLDADDVWGDLRVRERQNKNLKRVEYQKFKTGVYHVSGSSNRQLVSKKFNFNFSSRDSKVHSQTFSVPGRAVYYHVGGSRWRATAIAHQITSRGNGVFLTALTSGQQTRTFGPREPGYYRGVVDVYYVPY